MPKSLPIILSACYLALCALPDRAGATTNNSQCRKIPTGPGPHSLIAIPDDNRILVSSHDRRQFEQKGHIYEHNPANGRMKKIPRRKEPIALTLRPHNMAIRRSGDDMLLYVINHDDSNPNSSLHSIIIYSVTADGLEFRQQLHHPLLSSPNHISLSPDGDIYVSNDRRNGSSTMELVLRQKKATIVHHRHGQGWKIVADGLSFPNGVHAEQEKVLISKTFGNAVLEYPRRPDGSLGTPRTVISLPLLDGIFPARSAGRYYTISHGSLLDFLQHKRKSSHPSSSSVHAVNLATGKSQVIFSDDGRLISGISAALETEDAIYFGQSFEPFLLRCTGLGQA